MIAAGLIQVDSPDKTDESTPGEKKFVSTAIRNKKKKKDKKAVDEEETAAVEKR